MIGHSLGATGAMETIATVLQLDGQFLHPSLNCEDLHPEITAIKSRIVTETCAQELQIAAKASFGFGDVNSCLILSRWS